MVDTRYVHRSALGRDCSLGDLYNACYDQFCGVNILKKPLPDRLIQTQDISNTAFDYIYSDSLKEKFDKYNIDGGLGLSIICKFIPFFSGSGSYLTNDNKSEKCVRSSLIYKLQTKAQTLLFDFDLREYINVEMLENKGATHVVQKINWGANATVTLEANINSMADFKETQAEIKSHLTNMQLTLEGRRGTTNKNENKDKHFRLRVDADVMHDGPLPQTVEEALALISKIPSLLGNCNNGLGKPLIFILFPVNELKKYLALSNLNSSTLFRQLSDDYILKCIRFFDSVNLLEQKIFDQMEIINNKKVCLSSTDVEVAVKLQTDVMAFKSTVREALGTAVSEYRKGKNITFTEMTYFEKIGDFEKRLDDLKPTLQKIERFEILTESGAIYLGKNDSLEHKLLTVPDAFVIFISTNFAREKDFFSQLSYFLDLAGTERDSKMFVVDLDLLNNEEIKSTKIVRYKKGQTVSTDCFREASREGLNLMYPVEGFTYVTTKPSNRKTLEVFCPRALLEDGCKGEKVLWHCRKCRKEVEFGFDGYFYCQCGKGDCTKYKYRCAGDNHWTYTEFQNPVLTECLKLMVVTKPMNILLLGPSGVGKSTWVNSIINYLTYDNIEEARNCGSKVAIPVNINITDYDLVTHTVRIEVDDSTENLQIGESGTMHTKTYTFSWKDTIIRLIDTPGVGEVKDTNEGNKEEAIEREKKNISNIIEHISFLDEIHGICILMKPNESRFHDLFKLCIKEIFSNLHQSAIENVIFCFTHKGSNDGDLGETVPLLNAFFQIVNAKIKLSRHMAYFFENESFRYLCALHSSTPITYSQNQIEKFAKSWEMSVVETKRLFEHVKQLPPHKIIHSLSIADARKKIFDMTKPLADITKNILQNIDAVNEKRVEISRSKKSEEDLVNDLGIPRIDIMPIKEGSPRTVCASDRCVETRIVCGKTVTDYKKVCCENCWLPKLVGRNRLLSWCWSMNFSGHCSVCNCHFSSHVHTPYLTQEINSTFSSFSNQYAAGMSNRQRINASIKEMERIIEELKGEINQIIQVSIKFESFLRQCAIVSYEDAMEEYLKFFIKEEKKKERTELDRKVIRSLEDYLLRYKKETQNLKSNTESKHTKTIFPNEISKLMKSLENLKHYGDKFKLLNKLAEESSKNSFKSNEEYIFLNKTDNNGKFKKAKSTMRAAVDFFTNMFTSESEKPSTGDIN